MYITRVESDWTQWRRSGGDSNEESGGKSRQLATSGLSHFCMTESIPFDTLVCTIPHHYERQVADHFAGDT